MKIDWKRFSACNGYIRLKNEAISYQTKRSPFCTTGGKRSSESSKIFKRAIDLVQEAMHKTGIDPWDILDCWESKRRIRFINFYYTGKMCNDHTYKKLYEWLEPLHRGQGVKLNQVKS